MCANLERMSKVSYPEERITTERTAGLASGRSNKLIRTQTGSLHVSAALRRRLPRRDIDVDGQLEIRDGPRHVDQSLPHAGEHETHVLRRAPFIEALSARDPETRRCCIARGFERLE